MININGRSITVIFPQRNILVSIIIKHSSEPFEVEIEIISETNTAYAISNYRCALTVRTVLQLRMTRNISLRFHTNYTYRGNVRPCTARVEL